jgi:hypothetical protein
LLLMTRTIAAAAAAAAAVMSLGGLLSLMQSRHSYCCCHCCAQQLLNWQLLLGRPLLHLLLPPTQLPAHQWLLESLPEVQGPPSQSGALLS